ncbi:MAG: 30S ribosome-binding factor RbfA [Clostridia bacterium]|nr:30S ribosome-binding factor RbfA [Clostridia bacterium]
MKEKREKRLEKEFAKIIYELLTTRIKNPNITEMFSISGVKVTSDLEEAYVYVSVFSTNKALQERTFQAIKDSSFDVRKLLAKEMRIRTVPKINFILDTSMEYGEKIDRIISGFSYGEHNDDDGQ